MEPAKSFNNVILGQFVLTGVPIKVYVNNQFLIITDIDDIEDPTMGFGMDERGRMKHFDYRNIERLSVSGNEVDLDTYNKGMGAKEEEPAEEEPAEEEPKKEESIMKLGDILKEASQEEVDADIEGAEAQIDAAKAKTKAAKAAEKNIMKKAKEKIKAASAQPIDDGVVKEDHQGYTFGVGDIVKNKNTSCPHHGSQGIVKKMIDIPLKGMVAIYTVTNSGPTYSPGDSLAKTVDQLVPIQEPDALEGDEYGR